MIARYLWLSLFVKLVFLESAGRTAIVLAALHSYWLCAMNGPIKAVLLVIVVIVVCDDCVLGTILCIAYCTLYLRRKSRRWLSESKLWGDSSSRNEATGVGGWQVDINCVWLLVLCSGSFCCPNGYGLACRLWNEYWDPSNIPPCWCWISHLLKLEFLIDGQI